MRAVVLWRGSSGCGVALFGNGAAEVWESWREGWNAEANLPGDDGEYPEQLAELAESLLAKVPTALTIAKR